MDGRRQGRRRAARRAVAMAAGTAVLAAGLVFGGPVAAPAGAAAALQPPQVTSAYAGPGQDVVVHAEGPPGAQAMVHVASTADDERGCTKAMSGPGVTIVGSKWATLDQDGKRTVIFSGFHLTAGHSIYATASLDGATTPVGNCLEVRAGPPNDVQVTAVTAAGTAATATVSWTQIPGATGYAVHLTRRNGEVLQTVDTGPVSSATVTGLSTSYLYSINVSSVPRPGEPAPAVGHQATQLVAPPFRTVTALVRQQYLDLADRPPTNAEDFTWFSELYVGKYTSRVKIDSLVEGPRWGGVQSPVSRACRAAFGRWPDAGGLAYWSDRRRAGTSVRMIAAVFTQSSEFQRKYGALGNRDFVKRIYLNVLGRSADAGGLAYWAKRLESGAISRSELLVQFSEGSEHVRRTAAAVGTINVFTGMLRRMPTAAELATWAGTEPPLRTDLILHVLGTEEYGARITR